MHITQDCASPRVSRSCAAARFSYGRGIAQGYFLPHGVEGMQSNFHPAASDHGGHTIQDISDHNCVIHSHSDNHIRTQCSSESASSSHQNPNSVGHRGVSSVAHTPAIHYHLNHDEHRSSSSSTHGSVIRPSQSPDSSDQAAYDLIYYTTLITVRVALSVLTSIYLSFFLYNFLYDM